MDVVFVVNGWGVDRGLLVLSMKIYSFSELLDMVEQPRKKIRKRVTRFKIKVNLQLFFFLLRFLIGDHDHELTDLIFTDVSGIVMITSCLTLNVVILSVLPHLYTVRSKVRL